MTTRDFLDEPPPRPSSGLSTDVKVDVDGNVESKTKPITFRVRADVLDALAEAGISPSQVVRAALEREASRARKITALDRILREGPKVKVAFDVVEFVRRGRDSRA